MRIRYSNALLWRGLDDSPALSRFDVVDGAVAEIDTSAIPDHLVELNSAFVMPAFRDGHCHPLFAGREHTGPDVTDVSTLSEVQSIILAYANEHPEATWIDGAAYDRSIDAEFHRSELDAAVADRPVVLHGADHHTLWVNTKALELAGLLDALPAITTGSIDVDDAGVATGVLREWEAMQLVMKHIPPLTLEQELDSLDWAQNRLLKFGVVEVQDAWIDPGMTEVYLESARRDRLRVTTNLAFRADPASWHSDFKYFEDMRGQVRDLDHPALTANAMKFFVDGVLGSSTASVLEPYVSGPSAHQHGEQVWQFEELVAAARKASDLGFQLHLHAIGDAAVRAALDVIEEVNPSIPSVIAHSELVSDEDVPRFEKLNVTANFQPLWAREDGQLLTCVPQVGRKRLDTMYRMRDLAAAGAKISFGSDWPVSSPDALLGAATAVNRSMPGGASWTKHQSLTIAEALRAYTSGVATQLAKDIRTGTLQAGQSAEFVVLNANPFALNESDLFDLRVIATSTLANPLTKLN
ncbi:MAG: amidohydrolase [Rhodoluna sp.]|nr:amidohydrolase [Rhodoluna sp.]